MTYRIAALMGAVSLLFATAAPAQLQDVRGTVDHIDPAGRTIHFVDGRIVHLRPGATILVDGREASFDTLQRGTLVTVRPGPDPTVAQPGVQPGVTPGVQPETHPYAGRTGVQPGVVPGAGAQPGATPGVPVTPGVQPGVAPPAAAVAPTDAAVQATGVVSRVDEQARTITLEDGRTLRLPEGADAWQPVQLGEIQTGAIIFITGAQPAGFRPHGAATMEPWGDDRMMGTVAWVDAQRNMVMLNDGTVLRVSPGTRLLIGEDKVTIADLEPGAQVIVKRRAEAPMASPPTTPPAAAPAPVQPEPFARGEVDAEEILIIREPQRP